MEKRVYPDAGRGGKGLRYVLLFLSAAVIVGGLLVPGAGNDVSLGVAATATPIPTDESFDETRETREWTLAERVWYALQLGSFEDAEQAEALAAQFRGRGAAGYIWSDTRERTLAALYENRVDAKSVRDKLWENHGVDAYAYEITLPALTLRMSGMKGQLDILQSAFDHAYELVASLQALSLTLDRQEATVAEANAALRALGGRMETVSLRLRQRFAQPRHSAVDGLIGLLDVYAAFARSTRDDVSSAALATDVKYRTLEALYALKTLCNGLADT